MTSYAWLLLLDVARAVLIVGVAFVFLPMRAMTSFVSGPRGHRAWGSLLIGCAASIGLVHLLAALNLYDGLALLLALPLAAVGAVLWQRYDSFGGAALNRLLADGYAHVLRRLDRTPGRHQWQGRLGRKGWRRRLVGWPGALSVLLAASALLRLEPLVTEVGPFSMQYYATLEAAKFLQVDSLYYGLHPEARGLHALLVAVHTLSRVELSVLAQVFGALSGVAVVYGLYQTVRGATGRPSAAFVGAASFGLGSVLLPFGIERQVEASTSLLAAALALTTFFFAGQYLLRGTRRTRAVMLAGAAATLLTSFAIGTLLVAGLLLLAIGGWMVAVPKRRLWQVAGTALAAGAVLALGAGYLHFVYAPGTGAGQRFTIHEGALGTADLLPRVRAGIGLLGALLLAAAVSARNQVRRFARAVAGSSLLLLLLAQEATSFEWDAAIGAVLSVASCAAVGVLLAPALSASKRAVQRLALAFAPDRTGKAFRWGHWRRRALPLGMAGAVVLVTAVGGFRGATPLQASFAYTVEPPGFTQAMQQLERRLAPYQWTVVSHYGTGLRAMNRGRFMDYPYFLQNYNPRTYDHTGPQAIPTPDLFIFVEKGFRTLHVLDELLPPGDDLMRRAADWCQAYDQAHAGASPARRMTIFYESNAVRVCRLSRPPRPETGRADTRGGRLSSIW